MTLTHFLISGCVIVAVLFFISAWLYIRQAARLSTFINANCPELWQYLYFWIGRQSKEYSQFFKGGQLESLIVWNTGAEYHPSNPEFRKLLWQARIIAMCCLFCFTGALILLGLATTNGPLDLR